MKRALPFLLLAVAVFLSGPGARAFDREDEDDVFSGPLKDMVQDLGKGMQRRMDLQKKMSAIIITKLDLTDVPLVKAVELIRRSAKELDPSKKGVNIVYAPGVSAAKKEMKVTLELADIPVSEALKYTLSVAGLALRFEEYAVVIFDPGQARQDAPPQSRNQAVPVLPAQPVR